MPFGPALPWACVVSCQLCCRDSNLCRWSTNKHLGGSPLQWPHHRLLELIPQSSKSQYRDFKSSPNGHAQATKPAGSLKACHLAQPAVPSPGELLPVLQAKHCQQEKNTFTLIFLAVWKHPCIFHSTYYTGRCFHCRSALTSVFLEVESASQSRWAKATEPTGIKGMPFSACWDMGRESSHLKSKGWDSGSCSSWKSEGTDTLITCAFIMPQAPKISWWGLGEFPHTVFEGKDNFHLIPNRQAQAALACYKKRGLNAGSAVLLSEKIQSVPSLGA